MEAMRLIEEVFNDHAGEDNILDKEELKKMMREGILSIPEKMVYSEFNQPLRSSYSLLRRTHSVAFEKYF